MKMWAIRKEENAYYAVKNNARMRFSRSKTECPPLERLAIPSKEDLRSKGLHCDAKRAVIVSRNIRLNSKIRRRKIIPHIYKLQKIHFHTFIITSLFAYEQVSSGDFQCTASCVQKLDFFKNKITNMFRMVLFYIYINMYVCVCKLKLIWFVNLSLYLSPLSLSFLLLPFPFFS